MDEALQIRAAIYSLLHSSYSYPLREELLQAIQRLEVDPESHLFPGLQEMQAGIRMANPAKGGVDGRPARDLEMLNIEMTRLLEGPGVTPAPPYASYYLHEGRLMGPAAIAARRTYLKWHALPTGETRLPEDHLALELGFLAHLAVLAGEAGTGEARLDVLRASRDFIQRLVLPWLPRFCSALAGASREPFFRGLASFTEAFLQWDMEWLSTTLGMPVPQPTPGAV